MSRPLFFVFVLLIMAWTIRRKENKSLRSYPVAAGAHFVGRILDNTYFFVLYLRSRILALRAPTK